MYLGSNVDIGILEGFALTSLKLIKIFIRGQGGDNSHLVCCFAVDCISEDRVMQRVRAQRKTGMALLKKLSRFKGLIKTEVSGYIVLYIPLSLIF